MAKYANFVTYNFVVLYLAMDTGQVDFNCHGRTNFWVVHQGSKEQHINTFTAAVDTFSCDYVATEMARVDGNILFVHFKFVLLKFIDWKARATMDVSVSDSDELMSLINISYNVRHLYFVLRIQRKFSANK